MHLRDLEKSSRTLEHYKRLQVQDLGVGDAQRR